MSKNSWIRVSVIVLVLTSVSGCSIVSGFGKRETKFEEPPAYYSVPAASVPPSRSTGSPKSGTDDSSAPKKSQLPWLMSDRAQEISRGIDEKTDVLNATVR